VHDVIEGADRTTRTVDLVNPSARVILIGITPGRTPATNALKEAQRLLLAGATLAMALASAKLTSAFSGAMRPDLVSMLDRVGLATWLSIRSCKSLLVRARACCRRPRFSRFPCLLMARTTTAPPT